MSSSSLSDDPLFGILDPTAPMAQSSAANALPGQQLDRELPEVISGSNPLVAAANPLLNLIPQIRSMISVADAGALQQYLCDQIRAFEARARKAGIAAETIIGARYCLCTALDETAAQTPWGSSGAWPKFSLLVTFHNETWGGEKFFQLLAKLAQNPQQHINLIELMYYCIALGFEGRYRIIDNGRTQLITLQQRLVQIIKGAQAEHERALSPHWRGLEQLARAPWTMVPLWVAALIAGLVALGIYAWLATSLARDSDQIFLAINAIKTPRPQPRPVADKPRLRAFLEPEIREGLVEVRDEVDRSIVTLKGDGMFNPGSTDVKPRYLAVINRVALALDAVAGSVLVVGHTDNIPIRTARFPSNWELSKDRAQTVASLLQTHLTQTGRARAEGRAEAEPVALNTTPEGRSSNRRVEIILQLAPAERDREINRPSVQ